MQAKYWKQLRKGTSFTSATPTDWVKLPNQCRSKKTGNGTERDRAQRAAETAGQRNERLRNWGWGIMPNMLLKLLEKTSHFTVEKDVKKGKWNLRGDRNEVTADERQTGSGKFRGERLKITQTRTNQHAKLAGEITLQQRSPNQREWIGVETPEERELRLEC